MIFGAAQNFVSFSLNSTSLMINRIAVWAVRQPDAQGDVVAEIFLRQYWILLLVWHGVESWCQTLYVYFAHGVNCGYSTLTDSKQLNLVCYRVDKTQNK